MPSAPSSFPLLGKLLEWAASGTTGRPRHATWAAPDAFKNQSWSSAPRRSEQERAWAPVLGHFFLFQKFQRNDSFIRGDKRIPENLLLCLWWCQRWESLLAPPNGSQRPLSWAPRPHLDADLCPHPGPLPLKGPASQHRSRRGPDLTPCRAGPACLCSATWTFAGDGTGVASQNLWITHLSQV